MATRQIIVLGASVQRNVWEYNNVIPGAEVAVRNQMFTRLQEQGDMAYRSYAAGGDELLEIQAQTTQALADLITVPTNEKSNYLFHIHAGGNDVSGNGAWPWTQQLQDDFVNQYTQILEDITNAGFEVAVCELTYRGYSEDVLEDGATNQDRAGLVNTNLVWPLIQQYSPNWWDSVNGIPVLDVHRVSYEAEVLGNYFAPPEAFAPNPQDTIHPGPTTGTPVLQQFYAETLGNNPNSPVDPAPPKRIFTVNASAVADTVDNQLRNVNRIVGTDGLSGTRNGLIDIRGNSYPTASLEWIGWSSTASTGSGVIDTNPRQFLPTARHYYAAATYLSVNPGLTASIVIGLGPTFANRPTTATLTSGRAAGVERGVTNIVSQGQLVTIEPDVLPRQIRTLSLVADANGDVQVDYSLDPNGGGFAAYASTITLEIDETVTITGQTTLTAIEEQTNTYTYTIPNATTVTVSGTLAASIANVGGDQYLLTINPVDYDSGVTSGTLTINASNDLDSDSLGIDVTITNVNENTITPPGDLSVFAPETGNVDETYAPIAAWLTSTNATGNNVSGLVVNGRIPDGSYTVIFTLIDANNVSQNLTITTKVSPVINIEGQPLLSGAESQIPFTVTNDSNNTVVTSTLGTGTRDTLGNFTLTIPPQNTLLGSTRNVTLTANDGVNPPTTAQVTFTIIDSNVEEVPDVIARVKVNNPYRKDSVPAYVDPIRNNKVYIEFIHSDRIIDFSQANRIVLSSRQLGGTILDTGEFEGAITTAQIKDTSGRLTKVLEFNFNSLAENPIYGEVPLSLVVWDDRHPSGQVIVSEDDKDFRLNFRRG